MMIKIDELRKTVQTMYTQPIANGLHYHAWDHTAHVEDAAVKIGELEEIAGDDLDILRTSSILHDVGNIIARSDHEETGADFATVILPFYGAKKDEIDTVCELIMATKFLHEPTTLLQEIMIDADMSVMGTLNWIEVIDGYRYQEIHS